jgi:hypothetical protein
VVSNQPQNKFGVSKIQKDQSAIGNRQSAIGNVHRLAVFFLYDKCAVKEMDDERRVERKSRRS